MPTIKQIEISFEKSSNKPFRINVSKIMKTRMFWKILYPAYLTTLIALIGYRLSWSEFHWRLNKCIFHLDFLARSNLLFTFCDFFHAEVERTCFLLEFSLIPDNGLHLGITNYFCPFLWFQEHLKAWHPLFSLPVWG